MTCELTSQCRQKRTVRQPFFPVGNEGGPVKEAIFLACGQTERRHNSWGGGGLPDDRCVPVSPDWICVRHPEIYVPAVIYDNGTFPIS